MIVYIFGLHKVRSHGAANKCSVVQHGRVVDRWQEGLAHWDAAMQLLRNPQSLAVKRSEPFQSFFLIKPAALGLSFT